MRLLQTDVRAIGRIHQESAAMVRQITLVNKGIL